PTRRSSDLRRARRERCSRRAVRRGVRAPCPRQGQGPDEVVRFLLVALCAVALAAQAQEYPTRPIRLLTPAAPGGTTALLARLFGAKLSEALGQQVIVDNRASASGVVAGDMTAKAAPDGYTLLLAYHQHTVNAVLNPSLPYHPVNDFT